MATETTPDTTVARPEWLPFLPASDAPLPGGQWSSLARTDAVVDQLADLVAALTRQRRRWFWQRQPQPMSAHRIGLLGGLGQGKTSALQRALSLVRLRLKSKSRGIIRPLNVVYFDAAKELPQDLEFEFDRLQASLSFGRLLGRSVLRAALLTTAVLGLLLWGAMCLPPLPPATLHEAFKFLFDAKLGFLSRLAMVVSPMLVFMPAAWKFRRRRWERQYLFSAVGGAGQSWLQRLGAQVKRSWEMLHGLCFSADVMAVDNLDRASLAQQRALLRALYKHQDELRCTVIVAFDETALLRQGSADPEAPDQLLAKAIEVNLRLPDRLPVEALALAQLAVQALPQADWRQSMGQYPVVSALAQALLATTNLSPRGAKRLLNDSCTLFAQLPGQLRSDRGIRSQMAAVPLSQRALHWMPAILRLQALWQLNPILRDRPLALAASLMDASERSVSALRTTIAPASSAEPWVHWLTTSPDLRPVQGEWHGLVGAMGTSYWAPPQKDGDRIEPWLSLPFKQLDSLWRAVDGLDACRDHGIWRSFSGFMSADADLWPADLATLLPGLLCVVTLWSATEPSRERSITTMARMLQACAEDDSSWLGIADHDGQFRRGLCRLLLVRAGSNSVLDFETLTRWLAWAGPTNSAWRWASLMLCRPDSINWADLWCLLDAGGQLGALGVSRLTAPETDAATRRHWAAGLRPFQVGWAAARRDEVMAAAKGIEFGVVRDLLDCWPIPQPPTAAHPLPVQHGHDDLTMFRAVRLSVTSGVVDWPDALLVAMSSGQFGPRAWIAMFAFPGLADVDSWDLSVAVSLSKRRPDVWAKAPWARWIEVINDDATARAALLLLMACQGLEVVIAHWRVFKLSGRSWPSAARWPALVNSAIESGMAAQQRRQLTRMWVTFFRSNFELMAWLRNQVLESATDAELVEAAPQVHAVIALMLARRNH